MDTLSETHGFAMSPMLASDISVRDTY